MVVVPGSDVDAAGAIAVGATRVSRPVALVLHLLRLICCLVPVRLPQLTQQVES